MLPVSGKRRKLLVASIGVATMTYVGTNCGGATFDGSDGVDKDAAVDHGQDDFPVANLVAPPVDASKRDVNADRVDDFPVANLVAPPVDATIDLPGPKDASRDLIDDFPVANLVPGPHGGMN